MLSLGFPALLKGSSSRRSLQADKHDSGKNSKDAPSTKAAEKEAEKSEKERQRKEDKDRSESRISVLIGRKRGKV
jgi:dual specificity tyrosine-phosphorylation-regulated kinase 2/3/4